MHELLKKRLQCDLIFIENKDNYYAMFGFVLDTCTKAQFENLLLYEAEKISDSVYVENASRIQKAKELAIKTHMAWTIKFLNNSATQHTKETIVSSIYSDVFGTSAINK